MRALLNKLKTSIGYMFKSRNIKSSLLIITVIPCTLLAVVSGYSCIALRSMSNDISIDAREVIPGLQMAGDLTAKILSATNSINVSYQNTSDVGARTQGIQLAKSSLNAFSEIMKTFEKLNKKEEAEELYTELLILWPDLEKDMRTTVNLLGAPSQSNLAKAGELIRGDMREKVSEAEVILADLRSYYQDFSREKSASMVKYSNLNLAISIALGVLGILAALITAALSARSILRKLEVLSTSIDNISERLERASHETLSSGEKLSSTARTQYDSLQLSSASLEELASVITSNTENANSTAKISKQSELNAITGQSEMDDLTETVSMVHKSNHEFIDELSQGNIQLAEFQKIITDINSKTQVINDIVFQTRLLSFNASVEAARAGEYGKGFGVVAEEIGNLAQMSGSAAVEITSLLATSSSTVEQIISDSSSRLQKIEQKTNSQIEESLEKSRNCSGILQDLVHVASTAATQSADIAANSNEQTKGIESMKKAMDSLNSGMTETTNIASHSAMAAQDLFEEVSTLRGISDDLGELMGKKSKAA